MPKRAPQDDSYDEGFSYRLRQAIKTLELARGSDFSQEELGRLVGEKLNRDPYTGVAVHRWLKGRRPSYAVLECLAQILNVPPGWLAFGDLSPQATLAVIRSEAAREVNHHADASREKKRVRKRGGR
jgi:transcriptional regulator with XRE-family HTH domain